MKNILLAAFLVPLLTMSAFTGSLNGGDKPMVVSQGVDVGVGGVGVNIGDRHRHHDYAVVLDREHHHHHHSEHDSDRR